MWIAFMFFLLALLPAGAVAETTRGEAAEIAYLAFDGGYWQAWVAGRQGQQQRKLTTSPIDKTRVSWFPDGKGLLVSAQEGRPVRVSVGGVQEELAGYSLPPTSDAVVAPDGERLAFSYSPAESRDDHEIFVAASGSMGVRRLTSAPHVQHEPAWSRDGCWIFYLSGSNPLQHNIWRVAVDSGSNEQLTVGSVFHFDVAVGPDGELAYSSDKGGNYDLWLDRPGEPPRPLTDHPALDASPSFSPDGKMLVFESTRSGHSELWTISVDGGVPSRLTTTPHGARRPSWWQGPVEKGDSQ